MLRTTQRKPVPTEKAKASSHSSDNHSKGNSGTGSKRSRKVAKEKIPQASLIDLENSSEGERPTKISKKAPQSGSGISKNRKATGMTPEELQLFKTLSKKMEKVKEANKEAEDIGKHLQLYLFHFGSTKDGLGIQHKVRQMIEKENLGNNLDDLDDLDEEELLNASKYKPLP